MANQDQEILKTLVDIFRQLNAGNSLDHEDIDLGPGNYNPGKNFQLYVGQEGQVVGISARGKAVNRHFIAGYHPVYFQQITKAGTTALSLASCFPD